MIGHEITCSSALNKVNGRLPFHWDLNIYRGCVHGCQYCYAMYSHRYLESDNFFTDIYIKTNIVERLEAMLSKPSWQKPIINIGGITDSYQPLEQQYQLMPEILKLCIKYKNPIIISTKSDLIIRDFDLIAELAEITYVNIACTVTCMNESIRQKIEPNSASSLQRLDVLDKFRSTKASIGLHVMPIIPYLTDDHDNIDLLFSRAAKINVDYVLPGILYLRGNTRDHFLNFMQVNFPDAYPKLVYLYDHKEIKAQYKQNLYSVINRLRDQYRLSYNYSDKMNQALDKTKSFDQLRLF